MTVVVARKIGEKMLTFSDTMLTDRDATTADTIPGVLKTVVIDLNITISFSGIYPASLDAVRKAKSMFKDHPDIDSVLEFLRRESEAKKTDFIIAAHRMVEPNKPKAELRKIWDGNVSAPVDECWIGDAKVADFIIGLNPPPTNLSQPHSLTADDLRAGALKSAIQSHFMNKGSRISEFVGGFPILAYASPFGHTYDNYGGNKTFGPRPATPGMTHNSNSYSFSMNATGLRGIALLGVYVQEAQVGYIYNPIIEDHPRTVPAPTMPDMNRVLDKLAIELGGVETSHWEFPGEGFPRP